MAKYTYGPIGAPQAASPASVAPNTGPDLRAALERAKFGVNRIHDALQDPTMPRQSIGEMTNFFLQEIRTALGETTP